jgi:hypothetical protein
MDTQNALVPDLLRIKWGMTCPASNVARHIYDKLDSNLRNLAERISLAKLAASNIRHPLAYPDISDALVEEFLEIFDDGGPGLAPLEIQALNHIKLTATSIENIQAASGGHRHDD